MLLNFHVFFNFLPDAQKIYAIGYDFFFFLSANNVVYYSIKSLLTRQKLESVR